MCHSVRIYSRVYPNHHARMEHDRPDDIPLAGAASEQRYCDMRREYVGDGVHTPLVGYPHLVRTYTVPIDGPRNNVELLYIYRSQINTRQNRLLRASA